MSDSRIDAILREADAKLGKGDNACALALTQMAVAITTVRVAEALERNNVLIEKSMAHWEGDTNA